MIPRESTSLGLPQTALGEQHTDYTSCLNNLAVLYQAMGKYLDAAPLWNKPAPFGRRFWVANILAMQPA